MSKLVGEKMTEIYKCLICEKQLANKGSLKTHMRVHSDETPFQCDKCDKRFKLKPSLDCHQLVHTKEKMYECEICHQRFGDRKSVV